MNRGTSAIVSAITMFLALAGPVSAQSLKITSEDGNVLASFDQSSIEALGLEKLETATPWTDGIVRFEGVSIKKVLTKAGVSGESVTGFAADDYAMRLPAEIIENFDPIIATRMNGISMSLDNKGPFWIMFDFDSISPETSDEIRNFAIWHLSELEVE